MYQKCYMKQYLYLPKRLHTRGKIQCRIKNGYSTNRYNGTTLVFKRKLERKKIR